MVCRVYIRRTAPKGTHLTWKERNGTALFNLQASRPADLVVMARLFKSSSGEVDKFTNVACPSVSSEIPLFDGGGH